MRIVAITILIILIIVLIYFIYQIKRVYVVSKIRINWIDKGDKRLNKYSLDYMSDPNKSNWWGLRYPKDKHYK